MAIAARTSPSTPADLHRARTANELLPAIAISGVNMADNIKPTTTTRTDEAERLRKQLLRMIVKNEQQRKTPVTSK